MWPEGADGQLCLHPALGDDAGHVPDGVPLGPAVHLHIDVQGARAGPVAAGEVVMEIDAVRVILLQGGQEEVGLLAGGPPGAVHHHEGAWRPAKWAGRRQGEKEKPPENRSHPSKRRPEMGSLQQGLVESEETTSPLSTSAPSSVIGNNNPTQQGGFKNEELVTCTTHFYKVDALNTYGRDITSSSSCRKHGIKPQEFS